MHLPSDTVLEGSSHPRGSPDTTSHDVSEPTLPKEQGQFSLENTMRETLRKLALEISSIFTVIHHPLGWKARALRLGPLESTSTACA